jgi:hypothetical protein
MAFDPVQAAGNALRADCAAQAARHSAMAQLFSAANLPCESAALLDEALFPTPGFGRWVNGVLITAYWRSRFHHRQVDTIAASNSLAS